MPPNEPNWLFLTNWFGTVGHTIGWKPPRFGQLSPVFLGDTFTIPSLCFVHNSAVKQHLEANRIIQIQLFRQGQLRVCVRSEVTQGITSAVTPLRHHFVLLRLGSPSAYLAFALMAHGEVEFAASGVVAVLFRHSRCSLVVVPGAPQFAQHCAAVDKREAATDVGSWCGIPTSISLCCDKTSFSHGELLQVYCGVYGLLKSNRTMRRQSFNIRNQHKALHKETERERERESQRERETERERERERRKERTDTT